MIIIFGTRNCGAVDKQDGEYAVTRCFHIYYLPIIPLQWMWVSGGSDDEVFGISIRPHLRSLVAAYLRSWGLVAAIGLLANASLAGAGLLYLIAGIVTGAAVALSWRWYSRRGQRDLRAGDLIHGTLGTYCDPGYFQRDRAEESRRYLEAQWPQYANGRSPNDVARLGPSSPEQALLAYGLLRLTARTSRGGNGRDAARLADRILDGTHEELSLPGGAYRDNHRQVPFESEQR